MVRLVHLSDLHFGADPEGQRPIFEGLLRVLTGERVDLLAFTGDVFDDAAPPPAILEGFLDLHRRLEAALGGPVPTLFLPGNHDRRGDGVFAPYREELFLTLRQRFAARPDVQVFGTATPFLAQRATVPGFPVDVVAYDSSYLPEGFVSAGGVVRQEDLIHLGAQLAQGDGERPLLFLLHHHLIPTPVTDTGLIATRGRPWLQQLLVGQVLPRLVSNGNREELTMTALGAGSALTTLQTLGRAVVVLHGHKHYATVRLLKGLDGDADCLVTSAGSCGLAQDWSGGDVDEAPKLWPSLNLLELDADQVRVTARAWSPWQPERRPSERLLVSARREGRAWVLRDEAGPERPFEAVLALNEARAELVPSRAQLGRHDVVVQRRLESRPVAWRDEYWEVVEGAPGAVLREVQVDGQPRRDAPCPAKVKVTRDGHASFRVEGGVFATVEEAAAVRPGTAFQFVELLNRSRAEVASLSVRLGPVGTTPFASVTDVTTGRERPYPLTRAGDEVVVRYEQCPARTLLRVYWPLPGGRG